MTPNPTQPTTTNADRLVRSVRSTPEREYALQNPPTELDHAPSTRRSGDIDVYVFGGELLSGPRPTTTNDDNAFTQWCCIQDGRHHHANGVTQPTRTTTSVEDNPVQVVQGTPFKIYAITPPPASTPTNEPKPTSKAKTMATRRREGAHINVSVPQSDLEQQNHNGFATAAAWRCWLADNEWRVPSIDKYCDPDRPMAPAAVRQKSRKTAVVRKSEFRLDAGKIAKVRADAAWVASQMGFGSGQGDLVGASV